MTDNSIQPQIVTYKSEDYSITMASSWKVQKIDENRILFIGPSVGDLEVGFYVTAVPKEGNTYLDAAKRYMEKQMLEKEYTILEEKDISKEGFKAFMRRSSWYHTEKDMVLFVRDVFTESDTKVFVLSCSIPNSENLREIENVTSVMMTSFKLNNTNERVKNEKTASL